MTLRLWRTRAAQLAIMGQRLDAERPRGILGNVRCLGRVQYVLPVLKGDRFIARFDARADRDAGTLRVLAMHAEPSSTTDDARIVGREVRALARWLKLRDIAYERAPRGWKAALA